MKKTLLTMVGSALLCSAISAQCTTSGIVTPVCDNSAVQNLSTTGSFILGPGVSGTNFTPSVAGPGSHNIQSVDNDASYIYTVNTTGTFAPTPSVGTAVTLGDDQLSGILPIGFDFTFFGNTYSDFYISSNGFVTFNGASGSGCCTGLTIPANDAINNAISWAWNDLNPTSGGTISYETIGTTPNRQLLITFTDQQHYGGVMINTAQIVLNETSNIIEIHSTVINDDGTAITQGIENAAGTQAYSVAGRNAANWTAANDYVAFIPDAVYVVDQTGSYAPIASTGTAVTLGDDQVSGNLPIGFSFPFFGNTYSEFYISSNGFITFDGGSGSGCCSGGTFPSNDAVDNAIAWAWNDLYPPGGGNITYETIGTAPNRKLLVTFTDQFHCCSGPEVNTSQIILNESSNIIEIHSTVIDDDGSLITQGIENSNGTSAYFATGRNSANWSATNDYIAFIPGVICDTDVLVVNATSTGTDAATICTGDSYTFGTQTLTTGGTYTEVFTSLLNGCDSTVTLTLSENPLLTGTDAAAICTGDSYTFGTQTLTAGGTFTEVFSSAITGCDSTVTLTLTENPVLTGTDAATICTGDSYTFGTQTLTAGGTFTEVFSSAITGCDSTVTLTLTENPVLTGTDAATICTGDSYTFGTQTLTAGGTFTEVFSSAITGCDSTVTLTLTENPVLTGTDAATICTGDSYTFGTQTLTAGGTFTEVFSSAITGCDSTVTLTLTENPLLTGTDAAAICTGDSYTFGTQTLTAGGTFTEVFSSAITGCDSTVTLTLTENPLLTGTDAAAICTGGSYTFGTQTLTAGGTFTEVFSSAITGCDSTVTLTLTENPLLTGTDAAAICTGDSYTFGTQTLTAGGTFTEVFSSAITGCDSTVTLTLTENPLLTGTDAATICTGDSYTFGTQTLTAGGTFTEVFSSAITGCDSTVTLTLTENPLLTGTDAAAICTGGSYTFGTQTLTAGGTFTEVFSSAITGCDSTVTLTLTENPLLTGTDAAAICTGGSYTFGTQTLTAGGTFTEVFSSAITGCDSTVTLTLTENPVLTGVDSAAICTGDSYTFGTQTLTAGGTFTEVFSSAITGCDSTVTLTLTENASPIITVVSVTDETLGTDGAIDIDVTGTSNLLYAWDNSATTEDISGLIAGDYIIVVTDDSTGCSATDTITVNSTVGIDVLLEGIFEVYPNPSNGIFNVKVIDFEAGMELIIYSSNGQQVMKQLIGSEIVNVDISDSASGTYFVRVISQQGVSIQTIILQD